MNKIIIDKFSKAKFNADGLIDCEIFHPTHGLIPFTVDPADTGSDIDVLKLDADLRKKRGAIAKYVPPPPPPPKTPAEIDAEIDEVVNNRVSEREKAVDMLIEDLWLAQNPGMKKADVGPAVKARLAKHVRENRKP